MNIATTALLFFALTAHPVLHVIEDYDEAGEDIPSIMDEIEQAQQNVEPNDVDAAEALGAFAALQQADNDDSKYHFQLSRTLLLNRSSISSWAGITRAGMAIAIARIKPMM